MGLGPPGSHHRKLKTRMTVRMMPRRRTKGSQVFTKAPMLMEEEQRSEQAGIGSSCIHPQAQQGCQPQRSYRNHSLSPKLGQHGWDSAWCLLSRIPSSWWGLDPWPEQEVDLYSVSQVLRAHAQPGGGGRELQLGDGSRAWPMARCPGPS